MIGWKNKEVHKRELQKKSLSGVSFCDLNTTMKET
jgi:hypothetical protein